MNRNVHVCVLWWNIFLTNVRLRQRLLIIIIFINYFYDRYLLKVTIWGYLLYYYVLIIMGYKADRDSYVIFSDK